MTLTGTEGICVALRDHLADGGDGRQRLLQTSDLTAAPWVLVSGAFAGQIAPGPRPLIRSVRNDGAASAFVVRQAVGVNGEYAGQTVTFSVEVDGTVGGETLTLIIRNEAETDGNSSITVLPTGWSTPSVTHTFGGIVDKIEVEVQLALGDEADFTQPQLELGPARTFYMPALAGAAPFKTELDAIAAAAVDGVTSIVPQYWRLGEIHLLSEQRWPVAFIIGDSAEHEVRSLVAAGKGISDSAVSVQIGFIGKAQPQEADALRFQMYRLLRALRAVLMDAEATSALGSWTLEPVFSDAYSAAFTPSGGSMFAEARTEITYHRPETR